MDFALPVGTTSGSSSAFLCVLCGQKLGCKWYTLSTAEDSEVRRGMDFALPVGTTSGSSSAFLSGHVQSQAARTLRYAPTLRCGATQDAYCTEILGIAS